MSPFILSIQVSYVTGNKLTLKKKKNTLLCISLIFNTIYRKRKLLQNYENSIIYHDVFLYRMPSNESSKPAILQEKVSNISLEYYKQVWNFIKRKWKYQLNRYCDQLKTIWNLNFLILFKIKRKIQEFNMLFQPMWN